MSIRVSALRGVSWSMASQAVRMLIQIATTILLARLLSPESFGIYAMALPFVALTSLLHDFGFNHAIIQKESITQDQVGKVFWINFVITLGVAVLLVAISPLAAWFYGEPRLTPLVASFALPAVLGSLTFGQYAMISRELRFRTLALIDISCATASFVTVVSISFFYDTYWALWMGALSSVVCWVILAFTCSSWRPGRPKRGVDLEGMFGFSLNIMIDNLATFAARSADNMLLGRQFGSLTLGYYDRAYKLLVYPAENLAMPVARVMVPILARLQGDREGYRRAYLQSTGLLNLVAMPGMAVAIAASHDVVVILLGAKWAPVAPIFFWLGFGGLLQPYMNSCSWLFLSLGRSADMMRASVISSVVMVTGFVIGARWGAEGVAAAFALVECAFRAPLTTYLAGRDGPVKARDLLLGLAPHSCAAALIIVSVGLISAQGVSGWTLLGVSLGVAYAEALAVLSLFPHGRKVLRSGWTTVQETLRKAPRPSAPAEAHVRPTENVG